MSTRVAKADSLIADLRRKVRDGENEEQAPETRVNPG